jgi:hypothetical protein
MGASEMPAESAQERLERQLRERDSMRQAVANYTGSITKCPPGKSTEGWVRRRTQDHKESMRKSRAKSALRDGD